MKIEFIDNIDPDKVNKSLSQIDLNKTLVLIVSKSGTTLETTTNEEVVRQTFEKAGINPKNHFISVTKPGTPMDDAEKYLHTFYLWDWIGGRFSTSSMGGGVLIAFACGMDVYLEFLRGAHAMDKAALSEDLHQNLPLLAALIGIWNRNFLNYSSLAVVPYSDALRRYPPHIQQVEMESNGKCIDRFGQFVAFETGPTVFGEPGTSAQHSFYQLIHQGTPKVALELIAARDCQSHFDITIDHLTSQDKLLAFLFAQMIALAQGKKHPNPNKTFPGNRPSHLVLTKEITPFAMGALLAFYEHKIAFQGYIWNINSFDQEGVQLGKDVANKILLDVKKQRSNGNLPPSFPLGQAYWNLLNNL